MSTSLPQAARSVRSSRSTTLTTTAVVLAGIAPLGNAAGFLEDSKASLETRNFYMNRDFRDGPGQSKREEWAQGFILNLQSGYTQGTVGFGLDAMGMLGVKLDSGRGRSGTGLLPKDSDGRAPDTYSKLGLTAKVKVSQSELKVGTLIPKLPSVQPNNGRIFPQIFEGALLTSKEIKDLGFTAGRGSQIGSSAARAWSVGPSISWAAFDLGSVRARLRGAKADADAALASYEQQVLLALEESANAFSDYGKRQERLVSLVRQSEASRAAAQQAAIRYREGTTDFLVLLDAEREQLSAEDAQAQAEVELYRGIVAIYRSLGGGWQPSA